MNTTNPKNKKGKPVSRNEFAALFNKTAKALEEYPEILSRLQGDVVEAIQKYTMEAFTAAVKKRKLSRLKPSAS